MKRPPIQSSAEGFVLEGDPNRTVLLLHGFTGSPGYLRYAGEYFHKRGMRVSAPLLPGHGTIPEDLQHVTRWHWRRSVDTAYARSASGTAPPALLGFSFGATLLLDLLIRRAVPASCLILVNPALRTYDAPWVPPLLPVIKHFKSYYAKPWAKDPEVRKRHERFGSYPTVPLRASDEFFHTIQWVLPRLDRVRVPVLILYSTCDRVIHPLGVSLLTRGLTSTTQEIVPVDTNVHDILDDHQGTFPEVFSRSMAFLERFQGPLSAPPE